MPEEIIGMRDMATIFAVTDACGVHRESVSVELSKADPGSIQRNNRGVIEITIPLTESLPDFASRLRAELERLGYTYQELADDAEE